MVESVKELRKLCYQGKIVPLSWYNSYVCMKFSIYITKLFLYTSITANQVTLIMLFLGIIGSTFFFNGFFITGLLLLHLSVVLDDVDGEIARYRKKKSMLGMYIDNVYHAVTNPLMLFGFAYGIYNLYPNKLLIIFGFLSAVFGKSVVMPSIFDTIVSMKIRGIPAPIRNSKTAGKEVLEYEGRTKEYKNPLLKIFHLSRYIWIFPSNLVLLTLVYIWEIINLKYSFMPQFLVSVVFFVTYGTFMVLNQIVSFYFHTKNNSIDSFYVFLFGKK